MKNFNELPQEIQEKAKGILKAYNEVNVIFENGQYSVTTATVLKSIYAPDHEVIGRYFSKDIFTAEERIINYVESFHDYPIEYKGKRDYSLMQELKKIGWSAKVKLENGNIILA